MKNTFLNIIFVMFFLLAGKTVMAEDFVTVYYHDGTHKMFFVSDIEHITMSYLDVDSVTHHDFQSQIVETNFGTYIQMINQIDSVVFSHVDMAYPRTDEELEATTQLANFIAVKANDIVDSLTNEGKRDPVLIVNEFMKIPGVIDAEVDDDLYSITMLRVDSIYHHFIFSNDNTIQGQKSFNHKTKEKKHSLIPKNEVRQSQTNHTVPLHEDGETKTIKEIKSVLILAPFENWEGKGKYDNDVVKLSEDIKELLNVDPIVLLDDKADITKFYGDYLDNFDMVIISTHGGAGKASGRIGTYTKKMNKHGVCYLSYSLGSEKDKLNNLPEIRYGQLEGSIKYRLCMTPKFLEKASFNGSVIFSYACHGFDGMMADISMTRSFLEHGASSFFGSIEIVNNILNKSVSNNIIRSFCAGAPLQDAFYYWKNCSMTDFYYNNEKEFYDKYKDKLDDDWLYQQNPEILKNQPKSTYPIYSKSPYPFNLIYDNSNGSFSWDSKIHSFNSVIKTVENITEEDNFTTAERDFLYIPTYDIYVNGRKINDEELTDCHFSWKPNISGTYRWYVVAKFKNEKNKEYDEYVSTFKSKEETFTIEEYPTLILSSNSVSMKVGETTTVDITSGSGIYSIEKIEPTGIVSASISVNTISIDAKTAGTTTITIKDDKSGQTATIDVTVTGGSPSMDGEIVVERKYYVDSRGDVSTSWEGRTSNNYAYQNFSLVFNNNKTLSVNYLNAYYWDNSRSTQRKGVYIIGYVEGKKVKEWYIQPRKDKEWIKEKIVVTKEGKVSYFSNDVFMGEESFDLLSLNDATSVSVDLNPYGWWYTHYHYMDDFIITTPATVVKDDFNDGVLDLNIWQSPVNPDGVREEEGILKAEQLRTDRDYHLKSKPIPLFNGGGETNPHQYLTCPDNNHPHMIDLGLPSGTMWACCNVGASKPEDYGVYFAWGETAEKSYYDWSTYTHCDGSWKTCHDIGKDIAGTQYDAATVNWGSPWVMPNKKQMDELVTSCTSERTNENGVNGRRFTGPNGASIFLPAAGRRWSDDLNDEFNTVGSYGLYWSSTIYESRKHHAWYLYFYSEDYHENWYDRSIGNSVRPVRKN